VEKTWRAAEDGGEEADEEKRRKDEKDESDGSATTRWSSDGEASTWRYRRKRVAEHGRMNRR